MKMLLRGLVVGLLLFSVSGAHAVTFHRGNNAEPDSLDPHRVGSVWENNLLGDMFLGLTTEDAAGEIISGAAESWSVSKDNLTWTFKLRADLVWSDGTPLTAEDFAYSFRRLQDPKTVAKYAYIQYVIKNAEEINAGKLPIDQLGVRAVDPLTLEITLIGPTPYLLGLLTHSTGYPVPKHVIDKFGDDWVKPGNMVTNGAYVPTEWVPNGRIVAVKNPKFYDATNVKIDEVIYYPTEDPKSALTRFRAQELDANIGSRSFSIEDWPWLQENMPDQALITPQLAVDYIAVNMRRKPFDDIRVRKALSLLLDRETLANRVSRDGRLPAYALVPPGMANYVDVPPHLEYADTPQAERTAEGKRLLAEAGYGPDNPLTFEFLHMSSRDARREVAAMMAMWKQAGVIAKPLPNEAKTHYTTIQEFNFDVGWAAWQADYNDPQTFLYLLDSRAGAYNYGGYNNPAYDALMVRAAATGDLEDRAKIMAEAEAIMLADHAVLPTAVRTDKNLVADYVKGFVPNSSGVHRTRWMWLEK